MTTRDLAILTVAPALRRAQGRFKIRLLRVLRSETQIPGAKKQALKNFGSRSGTKA